MVREVELVSYLPPFMAEYKEIAAALGAENPEFTLAWKSADGVLQNEFIVTADEYGISRFEKLLGIIPTAADTLERRRSRVLVRWFNSIPYTERTFIEKLILLCGGNDFTLTREYDKYKLHLDVDLELFGQVEELERIIDTMLPCNLIVTVKNIIPCSAEGSAFSAGGVCVVETFLITNDDRQNHVVNGIAEVGGAISHTTAVLITNDFKERHNIDGTNSLGSGVVAAEFFGIE